MRRDGDRSVRLRVVRTTVALLSLVALLAGCANVTMGSEYREDGSATHSITITFERAALDGPAASTVATRLAEAETQARADGFQVERIDNPEELGLRVARTTDEAEDAGAALNSLLNSIANVLVTGPVAPFQGTFNTQSGAVGGADFTLELTVDGDVLADAIESVVTELSGGSVSSSDLRQQLTVNYIAVLPGEINGTDGLQIDEDSVRWDLPLDGSTTLTAESGLAEQGSTAWFIVAAIASFVGVIIVAAAVGYVLLHRHRAGRTRFVLPPADLASGTTATATEQPTGVAEVGSSLVRVVERVVSGGPPEPEKDDTQGEEE